MLLLMLLLSSIKFIFELFPFIVVLDWFSDGEKFLFCLDKLPLVGDINMELSSTASMVLVELLGLGLLLLDCTSSLYNCDSGLLD
jgi:hypothetical protein